MKKTIFLLSVAFSLIAIATLSACATTQKVDSKVTVNEDISSKTVVITDWSNRTLDEVSKPDWLKQIAQGNTKVFAEQFSVGNDKIIKYSVGTGRTREAALAASRVNYNAIRAEEIKTKVVSEAAKTLNNEQESEATSNAATLAKVDLTGHELVTQFWQEIKTTDKENGTSKTEFLCYSVYATSKENWLLTLKGFLAQVIPAIPNSQSQIKMANTIQSLYTDTTTEIAKSEADAKAAMLAQVEMARIEAEKEIAKAQASQPVVVQQAASSQSNDSGFNWMDALELAANVIF